MPFAELMQNLDTESNSCDKFFEGVFTFIEASLNEYETNIKEAELKVIKENGTDDDLVYLESEAKEGFLVRSKNSLKTIWEKLVAYIKKIKDAIIDFFNSKKVDAAISKTEKVCKKNPKLAKVKVDLKDYDSAIKEDEKAISKINTILSKIKAKGATEKDIEDIKDIAEEHKKNVAKILAGTIAVTVIAAITIIKFNKKKSENSDKSDLFDIDIINETDDHITVQAKCVAANTIATTSKSRIDHIKNSIFEAFKEISGVFTKEKKFSAEDLDSVIAKESTEEVSADKTETLDDEYIKESLNEIISEIEAQENAKDTDDDLEVTESLTDNEDEGITAEEYLKEMEESLFEEDDDEVVEESADDEGITAEEYLAYMESELFE